MSTDNPFTKVHFTPGEIDGFVLIYKFFEDLYKNYPNVVWVEIATIRKGTIMDGFRPEIMSDFDKYFVKAGRYFGKSPFTGGMAFNVWKFKREMHKQKAKTEREFFESLTPVSRAYACSNDHWRDILRGLKNDHQKFHST
jgi:hypothetical protein